MALGSPRASRAARLAIAVAGLALAFACTSDSFLSPHGGGLPASSTLPTGLTETLVASGLSSPTTLALLPDGRVLVSEQCGTLRVVKNGALLAAPMLALSVDCTGERGLLGVAADPAFATNGLLYAYYTVAQGSVHNRVSRFSVSGDAVVPGSEQVLIELDHLGTSTSHNGGALHFGLDGTLFISVGDNESSASAQSLASLFGKLLRINPDGSIPADNPFFATTTGSDQAIWALGFRNPYTFGIQPGTGRILIDDVGELTTEEINDGLAGSNYGWPTCEGPCLPANPGFRDPIYWYDHSVGCAIAGGDFYNPVSVRFPASYVGKYFFADYCAGTISVLDPATGSASGFASGLVFPVDLRTSPDGGLYYLQRGNSNGDGQLWRIDGTASQAPVVTQQPANLLVSVGQAATFSVSATGTAPLSYQWRRNGAAISGATSTSYTLAATALADSGAVFSCVVTSPFGTATSADAKLSVTTDLPPVAAISSPVAGTLYQGGQTITYAGTGTDPETGALPASAYTWEVVFHHDAHTHPFLAPTSGATGGSFVIPNIGETSANVYYAIRLTVTDPIGLTQTVERDVLPQTSTITLQASPSGAVVTLDGQPASTPTSVLGVVGIQRTLGVVSPQVFGGTTYNFGSWSDGGAATHAISTPAASTTYTATYSPAASAAAPVFVQANAGTGVGVTSQTVALPASTGAGNLVVVGIDFQGTGFGTISDGQGNSFVQVGSQIVTPGGVKTRLYYAPNIRGGAESVTITTPSADPSLQVYVAEYRGADLTAPLDVAAQNTGTSASVTSGAATTTTPNDLLFAFCVSDGNCSAGSGFSTRSTHSGNLVEDRAVSTTGAYAATGSSSSGWAIIMAAFRPQGGGGTTPPPAPVTASVTAANKVYDGTTTATITSCTLSGSPSGVTCSAAAANFSDPNVGTAKTVTATGITLGGANAGLYVLTSTTATTSADITAPPPPAPVASVTVSPGAVSVVVEQTVQLTATTRDSLGNVLTGRTINWGSANTSLATVSSNGLVTAVTAGGPVTITATSEGQTGTAAVTVTPKTPVTASVTAANKVYDGTTTATITSCTLSGSPSGVTCSAAAANFSDPNVGTAKTVTATGITLGGANAALYALTSTTATTTADITAAPPPTSPPAFIQANASTGTGVTSWTVPLASATLPGDLVVVGVDFRGAAFGTISDALGSSFAQVGSQVVTSGGVKTRLYYAKNIAGGTERVTVTMPAADASLQVYVAVYRGANLVSPLDVSAQRTGTGSNATSGNGTTTSANERIVGFCVSDRTCSAGTGFTARNTHSGNLIEDRTALTAGAYAATGRNSGGGWAMIMAAIRP
jgi:glucose/arabinose dehydrogenase